MLFCVQSNRSYSLQNIQIKNKQMKTNTKQYLKNISIEIFDAIEDLEGNTKKEKLQTMVKRFDQEYNYKYNKLRCPNLQQRFSQWLQGLPLNLPYDCYDIRKLAQRVHETDELTEKQYLKIEQNYWNHISFHCLKLARKNNIDLNFLY
jgi:hypothetical protein